MCKRSALLRLLIALFTITVFSLCTFTTLRQAEALTISNLSVASGQSYEIINIGLQNGTLVYIDRGYTFSSVPASLQGATYIKTANNDKASSGASFLTFDVDQDVIVYVAHDDCITQKPSWLTNSFADTGLNLVTTDTTLSIFESSFLAGTVTLGDNEGDDNSMYSVIIVGQGGTNQAPDAPVAKTGQTDSFGDGDDGDLQKGVAGPNPRFTINTDGNGNPDGTVTDNLTGLIWLKDAMRFGVQDWDNALNMCNNLADDGVGLTDGSVAGDWRLPNVKELLSLVHYGFSNPALSDTAGTAQHTDGDPFINVQSWLYWTSTSAANGDGGRALRVSFSNGNSTSATKGNTIYVWCVRGGQ